MAYQSTKTFGHELGLSCCFRQWRATHSHCSKLHGYAIAVKLVFEAETLDSRNWVMDFGGFGPLKEALCNTFDHKTLIAVDDPLLDQFRALSSSGAADVVVVPAVGCEAFAKLVYDQVVLWLYSVQPRDQGDSVCGLIARPQRVRLVSVEVREHGANSALYVG